MGIFDSFKLGPIENPELDKTKIALEKEKAGLMGKPIDQIFPLVDGGIMEDLKELGMDTKKQNEFREKIHNAVRAKMVMGTPDFQTFSNFLENPESLTELHKAIEDQREGYALTEKLKSVAQVTGLTFLTGMAPALGMYLSYRRFKSVADEAEKDGKKNSTLDNIMAFFMGNDKSKKAESKTPEEEAKAKEKKQAKDLKKKLSGSVLDLNVEEIELGIKELAALGIKDEGDKKDLTKLVENSLLPTSGFLKLRQAIGGHEGDLPDEKFKFKITDLKLNNLNPSNIELLVKAFSEKKEDTKFKLTNPNDLNEIRTFLETAKGASNVDLVNIMSAKYPMDGKPAQEAAKDEKKGAKKTR
jgi:hypothetical protein